MPEIKIGDFAREVSRTRENIYMHTYKWRNNEPDFYAENVTRRHNATWLSEAAQDRIKDEMINAPVTVIDKSLIDERDNLRLRVERQAEEISDLKSEVLKALRENQAVREKLHTAELAATVVETLKLTQKSLEGQLSDSQSRASDAEYEVERLQSMSMWEFRKYKRTGFRQDPRPNDKIPKKPQKT